MRFSPKNNISEIYKANQKEEKNLFENFAPNGECMKSHISNSLISQWWRPVDKWFGQYFSKFVICCLRPGNRLMRIYPVNIYKSELFSTTTKNSMCANSKFCLPSGPDVTPSCWLGSKHQLTNCHPSYGRREHFKMTLARIFKHYIDFIDDTKSGN